MAFPIKPVKQPLCLLGQSNGRIPDTLLEATAGEKGGPKVRLVEPAARSWRAMCAAARAEGITLKATSESDSYRPYAIQERIFRQRYTTAYLRNRPYRVWDGHRWYQKPGTAAAAVPGTSNHGWALAVDTGTELDGDAGTESIDQKTLAWLLRNEIRFGWSHEIQSEPWHIRYFAGDDIPAAVLAFEGDDVTEEDKDEIVERVIAALGPMLDKVQNSLAGYATTAEGARDPKTRSAVGRIEDHVTPKKP